MTPSQTTWKGASVAIEQWLITSPTTLDLAIVHELKVTLVNGSLNILTHDEAHTRVEARVNSGEPLRVALEGNRLIIDHPQVRQRGIGSSLRAFFDGASAEVSVLLPRTTPVHASSVNADLFASGLRAPIDFATTGGRLLFDAVTAPIRAKSVSGDVYARNHEGTFMARTASGNITAGGRIDHAETMTVSGETAIDVRRVLPDNISLRSTTGRVTLRLPSDATPVYAVSSAVNGYELDGQNLPATRGATWRSPVSSHEAEVSDVRIGTVSGRIRVVRGGATTPHELAAPTSPAHPAEVALSEKLTVRTKDVARRLGISESPHNDETQVS